MIKLVKIECVVFIWSSVLGALDDTVRDIQIIEFVTLR